MITSAFLFMEKFKIYEKKNRKNSEKIENPEKYVIVKPKKFQ